MCTTYKKIAKPIYNSVLFCYNKRNDIKKYRKATEKMIWQSIDIRTFSDSDFVQAFNNLDDVKRLRVEKFRQRKDKMRTVFADSLVRSLLSQELGGAPQSFCFSYNEHGKPMLADGSYHFNISHCEDIIVAAVDRLPIGIDVERIRDINLKIAVKYFCEDELYYLFGHEVQDKDFIKTPSIETRLRFFELWTAKEAYLKCIGTGLTHLKNVDTTKLAFERHLLDNEYVVTIYR